MSERKWILSLLLPFLAAAFGCFCTWAYLTYMQASKNILSVGTNEAAIVEEFEPPRELTAGENIYKKKVQVENTGTVSCFIRVFAGFSDSEIADISSFSPDGVQFYPVSEYVNHLPDGWVYIPEEQDEMLGGFYYYEAAVEPGGRTLPLFEKVMTRFEGAEQVRSYELFLYCESVQTAGGNDSKPDGEGTYREIWKEFMERR